MEHRLREPQAGPPPRVARRRLLRGPLAIAGLLALVLLGGDTIVRAGDPELARFLLEGGKKAVKKHDYEDGITRLEKALAEDPDVFEAHYWIGYAREKLGDNCAAVAAYRAFRAACQGCDEKLDRELSRLLRKVVSRLKVLAAAECELNDLNEEFVKDALGLARKYFVRDPELAGRAVEAVLALEPSSEAALQLKAKLGADSGTDTKASEAGGDGPTGDVVKWHDLLGDQVFGANRDWTYANGHLEINHTTGRFVAPPRVYEPPKAFVYEIEGQILEAYGNWGLGLMFGKRGDSWFACHLARTALVLWHVKDVRRKLRDDLVSLQREPFPLKTWFRLSVAVKGNLIEVFLDGKKQISHVVKEERDFRGDIGLFHQDSHCEIRTLRMGTRR